MAPFLCCATRRRRPASPWNPAAGHRWSRCSRICGSAGRVEKVVAADRKGRYALRGDRIRANQGHSVPVELHLTLTRPPQTLYHGTHAGALGAIRREGLRPMGRHHVHLSADTTTAQQVGARRGQPVVLVVAAGAMRDAGHDFYRSDNGVWLTDTVPPEFITFL